MGRSGEQQKRAEQHTRGAAWSIFISNQRVGEDSSVDCANLVEDTVKRIAGWDGVSTA